MCSATMAAPGEHSMIHLVRSAHQHGALPVVGLLDRSASLVPKP